MTDAATRPAQAPQVRSADCVVPGDFTPTAEYFGSPRRPFGALSIVIGFGPLSMRLEGLSADQSAELLARFRPFVGHAGSAVDLEVRLTHAGVPSFLALPAGGEVYRMGQRSRGGARDCWSYEFAGTLLEAGRGAELALVADSGPLFDRGLENYLRTLTASFILERGGLLLHGSAVVRGGRAHVFFGPSGSGKTTITHLSPRDVVLSDDLTLIVAAEDGYQAAGIPFGMAHHHVPDTSGSFPIASLNRLVQSSQVRREPVVGAQAVAEIASSLPFVMQDSTEAMRALHNADRLVRQVPVARLHFRKDDAFWSVLEEI